VIYSADTKGNIYMKKFRQLSILMIFFSSFFLTGCDVNQVIDVITRVAQGVQQAAPAIQQAVNAVQQIFPQNTSSNTASAPETPAPNSANTVITNPTDREEPNTTSPVTTTTPPVTTTTPPVTTTTPPAPNTTPSQAEAALANYQGGRLAPAEFVRLFGPVAREASRTSGVPASIIIAQAALETGWGRATIGNAKNLFGIKGTGPAGSVRVPTSEVINGRWVTIMDNFRRYNTWAESITDHGRLLRTSRYAPAMAVRNNPDEFARQLQRCGYATDPNYANLLISIMRSNNLYQYNN